MQIGPHPFFDAIVSRAAIDHLKESPKRHEVVLFVTGGASIPVVRIEDENRRTVRCWDSDGFEIHLDRTAIHGFAAMVHNHDLGDLIPGDDDPTPEEIEAIGQRGVLLSVLLAEAASSSDKKVKAAFQALEDHDAAMEAAEAAARGGKPPEASS